MAVTGKHLGAAQQGRSNDPKSCSSCGSSKGLKNVRGQVLWQNTTMLAMCAELGFHIADDPGDPGVKMVTLPVCTEHPILR